MNCLERILSQTIGFVFAALPQIKPTKDKLKKTRLVAHRGVHENDLAIENTLSAFQFVKDNNVWAAEFDVRFTRDNVPIVHHDPHCGRLFKHPEIEISHINFIDLRKNIPEIPTLLETVQLLSPNVHMMIEIKEDYRHSPERVQIIENILSRLQPIQHFHLICLKPEYLEAFRNYPKAALIDVFWLNTATVLQQNSQLGHGGVAGYFLFLSSQEIVKLHAQTKTIGVGFLDSENSLYREVNRGADFIFTNHPLRLKRYIDSE